MKPCQVDLPKLVFQEKLFCSREIEFFIEYQTELEVYMLLWELEF